MEEEDQDKSPFWMESSSSYRRGRRRLSGGLEIVVIAAVLVAVAFFFLLPFFSTASEALRPHSVRRSWDTLNLLLVLFAIICGFLSKASEDTPGDEDRTVPRSNSLTPRQSFGSSDPAPRYGGSLMRRNSSSYPDLKMQDGPWVAGEGPWRFYDDTQLYDYRSGRNCRHQRLHYDQLEGALDRLKDIQVDANTLRIDESRKQIVHYSTPTPSPPSSPPVGRPVPTAPPPPPPRVVKRREKRVVHNIPTGSDTQNKFTTAGMIERSSSSSWGLPKEGKSKGKRMPHHNVSPESVKSERDGHSGTKIYPAPAIQPPPPPPPPPPSYYQAGKKNKKRGGTTKDLLIALGRKKKKKQRQQSIDSLDILFHEEPSEPDSLPPATPPPPPPLPPPPPRTFLQNLFSPKKLGKSKKRNPGSAPALAPAPPPPPPPPRRSSRASNVKSQKPSVTSPKPTPPAKIAMRTNRVNENPKRVIGMESPLRPIPPPPPPPPFKMEPLKFVVNGDFARLLSTRSFKSESSDAEDEDAGTPASGIAGASPARSSDVDTKADKFIKSFWDGVRLEKMNSVKEKGEGVRGS